MNARSIWIATIGIAGLSMASCGPSDFSPENLINTVRVMASSASEPYAAPGDTVNLQLLAYDGRPEKAESMKLYWLPFTCENPPGDAYYGCFASIASGGAITADGGAVGSDAGSSQPDLSSLLKPGQDISAFLPTGPNYQVKIPVDAIAKHPAVAGSSAPYGLVIVFNIACAGHVEILQIDSQNPQQVPVGCFDSSGTQLSSDDYVFGYTRVYAYAQDGGITNTNPTITDVKMGDQVIDTHTPFVVQHGGANVDVDIDVPTDDSDWEVTADKDDNGQALHETVFASYFTSIGKVDDQVRIIYDAIQGRVSPTKTKFEPPADPGDGFIWIVLHDNRDGVSWVQIPIHVN